MRAGSIVVADSMSLVTMQVDRLSAPAAVPPSCHRVFVCDASGSMYDDLPRVGRHLKNTIALTVDPGDTVSLMWFSGRGQLGVVFEGITVGSPSDLAMVNTAIDRYLRPMGLTGFLEPLQEVRSLIGRLRSLDGQSAVSVVFMSDGHDNQWGKREILSAATALGEEISAGAVVEYGWYANRPLLTSMAEAMGVPYLFAQDFERFVPLLDAEFSRQVDGVKKRELRLPIRPSHDVCFAIRGGAVSSYAVDSEGAVRIPEDVEAIHFLSPSSVGSVREGDVGRAEFEPALYAALAVLSQRMLADETLQVLKLLGDVRFIKMFANCFGKQSYSVFQDAACAAAVDPALRCTEGFDPALVPPEDAYTVLDLLADLMDGEGNLLHIGHPAFDYQRIGRKAVSSQGRLSDEEQAEIAALTASAKTASDLEKLQARMAEIVASKPKPVAFKTSASENGVPLSTLVLNETRPNVSVLTRQDGVVNLKGNTHGLPEEIDSFRFRAYTVIKDGILNMKTLPVSVNRETFAGLLAQGLVEGPWIDGAVYDVSLERLPIVNRRMVRKVSAVEAFSLSYELAKARAAQKVFKGFEEKHFPKDRGLGLKAKYGEVAAAWLKEVGVTDGGFSPKSTLAEASDVYVGRELKIALKGLSSLPSVDAVSAKMDSGKKLTAGEAIMAPFVQECRDFVDSSIYGGAADPRSLLKTWISDKSKAWVKQARGLNRRLSEIKFAIVVGQVWFTEFSSLEEGTLSFKAEDGTDVTATATLQEIEVEI